jgi:hypothetical protein
MTVVDQLLAIRDGLKDWAKTLGGEVLIAMDHTSMWNVAATSQDFPNMILCFDHQEPRGAENVADVLGKVDNHFTALVSRGRGYDQDPGNDLVGSDGENQGSTPPFYDLVEAARDTIRQLNLSDPTNEMPICFHGIEKVPYDPDVPIYGYLINFSIGTIIGDLLPQDQNN